MDFQRVILLIFLSLACFPLGAQQPSVENIVGHWEGGFIKNNALQLLEVEFFIRDGALFSLQVMEEWHPQFGEFEIPVEQDSTGKYSMNTGLGKAVFRLDENYREIIGYLEGKNPAINLHLKQVPAPPAPTYTAEEVTIQHGGNTLYGHLHRPKLKPGKTAIIIVGGRSCYAGSTRYDLYAKLLRKYGVSVIYFHKRGAGKSTGDCASATIADLASDVAAWRDFLAEHPDGYDNIGILGSSAGGWVMNKAGELRDFDFLIGIVGPSTSVADQQLQSMQYGSVFYKLSPPAREHLSEYTKLMLGAAATPENFARFTELLITAEAEGWKELLEDTDIPSSAAAIDSLWVRRHAFDPGPVLANFDRPYLAIYGETDWIVPHRENIALLKRYFSGDRRKLLTTVLAFRAEHGTETKDEYVELPGGASYWHFFRISPQVQVAIVDFLRKHKFID
jgi:pimeloyl-ACP methyl ester carboxylesterase